LLAHLIDTSDASFDDPIHQFEVIENELASFSLALAEKPRIVVATKTDAITDRTRVEGLRKFCDSRGLDFHAVSSATGEGISELVFAMANALDRLPRQSARDVSEIQEQDWHVPENPEEGNR
jgi:GTP-binding protein